MAETETGLSADARGGATAILAEELLRCKEDFHYFANTYLKVIDRDTGKLIPFRLRTSQKLLIDAVQENGATYVLKARRMGFSRAILGYFFWQALFNEGVACATVAHSQESAIELFQDVRGWYEALPWWFKQGSMKLKRDQENKLVFGHGGSYRVGTAAQMRGGATLHFRHYSEFAFYDNPMDVVGAIEGGAKMGGRAVYETTANGLGYGWEMWKANSGWKKLFVPWVLDKQYTLKHLPRDVPRSSFTPELREYIDKWGIDEGQANFAAVKLHELHYNWRKFHENFPIVPELAFVSSKGRVFPKISFPSAELVQGYVEYRAPERYKAYVLGVDTAGGYEDGDFSAAYLIDATLHDKPVTVATFYGRTAVPDFAAEVKRIADRYGALIVAERNNNGLDMLNRLVEAGAQRVYREVKMASVGNPVEPRLGFTTSKKNRDVLINLLIEYIGQRKVDLIDGRLQTEINDFMWSEDGLRAEALRPNHDDMLFALAMALIGRDQITPEMRVDTKERPQTLEDKARFKRLTGKSPADYAFDDDEDFDGGQIGMRSAGEVVRAQMAQLSLDY
jgi:hypothetical protein